MREEGSPRRLLFLAGHSAYRMISESSVPSREYPCSIATQNLLEKNKTRILLLQGKSTAPVNTLCPIC